MKKISTLLILLFLFSLSYSQTEVNVVTGASYVDEVYYNFDDGSVQTVARTNWDIAFTTNVYDVNILANNGTGMMVYTYPDGRIEDWDIVDTTGIEWVPMYNSIEYWWAGAFVMNSTEHPDYGWGVYNDFTHNVEGDSLFIVELADGTYKKLAIIQKNSAANEWSFKYSNLDGSNLVEVNFDADDYSDTYFAYYSIGSEGFVVQEPPLKWQLLFTKYYDYNIPYYVTGVLTEDSVVVQQVDDVDQVSFEDYDLLLFNDTISQIGSDWKWFEFSSLPYYVDEDRVYFVQQLGIVPGSIWKLYFTAFSGSSSGTYTFMQENLTPVGIDENTSFSTVYPNPATGVINLIYDIDGKTDITIYDINGRMVYMNSVDQSQGLNKYMINIQDLASGLYNVVLRSNSKVSTAKFIKQ